MHFLIFLRVCCRIFMTFMPKPGNQALSVCWLMYVGKQAGKVSDEIGLIYPDRAIIIDHNKDLNQVGHRFHFHT